jgi:hypothetical protein
MIQFHPRLGVQAATLLLLQSVTLSMPQGRTMPNIDPPPETTSSPLWCITGGGAAGAPVGEGVTKVNIWGVCPAANEPGPGGVNPPRVLQDKTSRVGQHSPLQSSSCMLACKEQQGTTLLGGDRMWDAT